MISILNRPMRSGVVALAAIVLLSIMTAGVATADSGVAKAKFSAAGGVGFVGANIAPPPFTTSESKFSLDHSGAIKKIRIKNSNELVLGGLAGVTSCEDKGSGACGALGPLLAGSGVTSLHDSNVTLKVTGSDGVFATGTLKGRLNGGFSITTAGGDVLDGSTRLKIRGTATYACLSGALSPVPLSVCSGGTPGFQMFPLVLDVTDTGKFKIAENEALGVKSIKGRLEVTASVNLLGPSPVIGGTISITKAKAKLIVPEAEDED